MTRFKDSPNAPHKAREIDNTEKALTLRAGGASFRAIADALGVSLASTHKLVSAAIARRAEENKVRTANTVSPVKTATNAVCVAVGRSRGGSHGWRTAARQGAIGSPTAVACSTDRRWMAYPPKSCRRVVVIAAKTRSSDRVTSALHGRAL